MDVSLYGIRIEYTTPVPHSSKGWIVLWLYYLFSIFSSYGKSTVYYYSEMLLNLTSNQKMHKNFLGNMLPLFESG